MSSTTGITATAPTNTFCTVLTDMPFDVLRLVCGLSDISTNISIFWTCKTLRRVATLPPRTDKKYFETGHIKPSLDKSLIFGICLKDGNFELAQWFRTLGYPASRYSAILAGMNMCPRMHSYFKGSQMIIHLAIGCAVIGDIMGLKFLIEKISPSHYNFDRLRRAAIVSNNLEVLNLLPQESEYDDCHIKLAVKYNCDKSLEYISQYVNIGNSIYYEFSDKTSDKVLDFCSSLILPNKSALNYLVLANARYFYYFASRNLYPSYPTIFDSKILNKRDVIATMIAMKLEIKKSDLLFLLLSRNSEYVDLFDDDVILSIGTDCLRANKDSITDKFFKGFSLNDSHDLIPIVENVFMVDNLYAMKKIIEWRYPIEDAVFAYYFIKSPEMALMVEEYTGQKIKYRIDEYSSIEMMRFVVMERNTPPPKNIQKNLVMTNDLDKLKVLASHPKFEWTKVSMKRDIECASEETVRWMLDNKYKPSAAERSLIKEKYPSIQL